MSNMTTGGTSTYETGTNDTYTAVVDNDDTAEAKHVNGVHEAMVQVQTILGVGTDVKGSAADLVARLAVRHNADGTHKTQPVDEGGTNITSYTIGDLIYASTDTTTLSKLGIGGIYTVLRTNTATNAPEWGYGLLYHGPSSIGSGSTVSHSGALTDSSSTSRGGVYYCTSYTLDASQTITLNQRGLVIIARDSITINGTIDGTGQGGAGAVVDSDPGGDGTDQPGGGGGDDTGASADGGTGGNILYHGITVQAGGAGGTGGTGAGGNGTQIAGDDALLYFNPSAGNWPIGGAGGGNGTGTDGSGGNGGGSIVLIAPTITLGAASVLDTSGDDGNDGAGGAGNGGGGGAGNIYILCHVYTNNGATFTQDGGSGATGGGGGDGGDGAAGIKQILVYG